MECDDLSLFSIKRPDEKGDEEEDGECTWELCSGYGINIPNKMRRATPLVIKSAVHVPADQQQTGIRRLEFSENKCFDPSYIVLYITVYTYHVKHNNLHATYLKTKMN